MFASLTLIGSAEISVDLDRKSNATLERAVAGLQSPAHTIPTTTKAELGLLIQESTILEIDSPSASDRFGNSISVSGDTLIIGIPGFRIPDSPQPIEGSGAVFVYRSSVDGWEQEAVLTPSNPGPRDRFGVAVAIDGNTLVVGAPEEDSAAVGINGNQFADLDSSINSGAAYVFVRSGTSWSQQAYLKAHNSSAGIAFGGSVDISENTLIVGAGRESSNVNGNLGPFEERVSGAAYVFLRTEAVWQQQVYLKASNVGRTDEFGNGVAISGDTVVVGAPGESSNANQINGDENNDLSEQLGAAYIFQRSNSIWNQTAYLKPSRGRRGGYFGESVAIEGNRILIGAPRESGPPDSQESLTGAAYVFAYSGSEWSEESRLTASLPDRADDFGRTVSITNNSAAVGAPLEDSLARTINGDPTNDNNAQSGAAYLFSRTGSNWVQQAYIKASDSTRTSFFGEAIAISPDTFVVGCPSFDHPSTTEPNEPWVNSGKVYVYRTTIDPRTASNIITFDPIPDQTSDITSVEINAAASSGLPVKLTVVSGPAIIAGNTIQLTGGYNQVEIRAEQHGNAIYPPAQPVSRNFQVSRTRHLTYFGESNEGHKFAAIIEEGNTEGYLIGSIGESEQFFLLRFTVGPNGQVAPHSLKMLVPNGSETTPTFQFSGTLTIDRIDLRIAERGIAFEAPIFEAQIDSKYGSGFYVMDFVAPSSGKAYIIFDSKSMMFGVVVGPESVTSAYGENKQARDVDRFDINTSDGGYIEARITSRTTTITGTITTPDGSKHTIEGLSAFSSKTDRTTNLSTRAFVDTAEGVNLITGFVIGGNESKRVLLRAIGPTLSNYGVDGALSDPRLTLYDGSGTTIAEVDNWGGGPEIADASAHAGAFELGTDSSDSAYVTDLNPGVYTMSIQNDTDPGIVLAEIYDVSSNPNSQIQRLINISSRGRVVGGEGVLIGGFSITGNSPKRVLIRGVGPTLANYGVTGELANPLLKVFNSSQEIIARNDDWEYPQSEIPSQRPATADEINTANLQTGAFQLDASSKDSALIITLSPGTYTVELSSADGSAGTALIEIYELP